MTHIRVIHASSFVFKRNRGYVFSFLQKLGLFLRIFNFCRLHQRLIKRGGHLMISTLGSLLDEESSVMYWKVWSMMQVWTFRALVSYALSFCTGCPHLTAKEHSDTYRRCL